MNRKLVLFALPVCLLLPAAMYIRGCNQYHDRTVDVVTTFAVSPQEDKLVIAKMSGDQKDLYLFDLKTHKVTQLTHTPDFEDYPTFSPDGKWIAYSVGRDERADHIIIRSLNGKTVKQVTSDDYNDHSPAFSPDGKRLVFVRDSEYVTGGMVRWGTWKNSDIYSINTDGSGLQAWTDDSFYHDEAPQFSLDGKSVVFGFDPGLGYDSTDIGLITPAGQNTLKRTRFLTKNGGGSSPYFLPDGKHIGFFTSVRDTAYRGHLSFCQMNNDGSHVRPLAKMPDFMYPVLSANGQHLYFIAYSSYDLMRIDVDGKHLVKIADLKLF